MVTIKARFPTHLPSPRRLIGLSDLLALVDQSGLRWLLFEFEAIADPASEINVVDLEQQVLDAPSGVAITDDDLTRFVSGIRQFINLELHGVPEDSEADSSEQAAVLLTAHDSSEWGLDIDASRLDPAGNPSLWKLRY